MIFELFRESVLEAMAYAGADLIRTLAILTIAGVIAGFGWKSVTSHGGDWSDFVIGVAGVVASGVGVFFVLGAAVYGIASHPSWNEYFVYFLYFLIPFGIFGAFAWIGWLLNPSS